MGAGRTLGHHYFLIIPPYFLGHPNTFNGGY
jgi:hypothetical protein